MITPDFLNEIVKATEKNVADLQDYLLADICKSIVETFKNNEDKIFLTTTIKQMHQLMDSGMLLDDVQKQIEKRLPSLRKEIRKAFLISAQEISDYNTEIAKEIVDTLDNQGNPVQIEIPEFEKIGLPKETSQLNMTPTEVRKLEQMYKSTSRTVVNLTKTMPSACETRYISLCDEAFFKVQNGATIDEAVIDAIHEASNEGLHIVNYDSGHKDTIEVAIARAVRSGINKANAEIVLTRCGEMGVNYVLVSEHLGARVTKYNDYTNHSMWQGQVYKLDWNKPVLSGFKPSEEDYKGFKWLKEIKDMVQKLKDRKYPDFVDVCGYGELLGICGVNCRHTFSAFYPKVQKTPERKVDSEENKRRYEQEQELRAKERKLRKKKTELDILKQSGIESEKVTQRKAKLESEVKQLEKEKNAFARKNRLSSANWRTEITNLQNNKDRLKPQSIEDIAKNYYDKFTKKKPFGLDKVKKEYVKEIDKIGYGADELFKKIYEKYRNQIKFLKTDCIGDEYYDPKLGGIMVNMENDSIDFIPWNTTFHEIGHLIDYKNLLPSTKLDFFRNALLKDYNNVLKYLGDNFTLEEKYSKICERLEKDKYTSTISDIIGGITNNKCPVKVTHPDGYWDEVDYTEEAFAGFFGDSFTSKESVENIKAFFPNAYDVFLDLLRNML